MTIPNQSTIRGLNPGYALGELVVVAGTPYDIDVVSNKIYIFGNFVHYMHIFIKLTVRSPA